MDREDGASGWPALSMTWRMATDLRWGRRIMREVMIARMRLVTRATSMTAQEGVKATEVETPVLLRCD